jgi:hypothetical protein
VNSSQNFILKARIFIFHLQPRFPTVKLHYRSKSRAQSDKFIIQSTFYCGCAQCNVQFAIVAVAKWLKAKASKTLNFLVRTQKSQISLGG